MSARLPSRPGWAPVMHKRPRSWRSTLNPYPSGRSVTTTFRVKSTSTNCWRTEAEAETETQAAVRQQLVNVDLTRNVVVTERPLGYGFDVDRHERGRLFITGAQPGLEGNLADIVER
eukprot:1142215-Prorocentrum_minimum.AAC.1